MLFKSKTIFTKIYNWGQSKWNLWYLRNNKKQISIGNGALIKGATYFRLNKTGKLIIGKKFISFSGSCYNPIARNIRTSFCVEDNAIIQIGDNVGISSSCIWCYNKISIGNNVNIGADSIIIDSDAHSLNYIDRRFKYLDKENRKTLPIIIEDDVLIGARTIILKGVVVGARSIIGAGSVVSCNIPQDEIWAGNPAKFIKKIN